MAGHVDGEGLGPAGDCPAPGLDGPPGPELAAALNAVSSSGVDADPDQLLGVVSGCQRLMSWARALQLVAVLRFMEARGWGSGRSEDADGAVSEIGLVLGLGDRGASRLAELAWELCGRLPGTWAALRSGLIDEVRARVIAEGVVGVDAAVCAWVEAQVLPSAAGQSVGRLRRAVARAVLTADPQAAEARRERAERQARVEVMVTPDHTVDFCGRDLPAAEALSADQRLTALAKVLRDDGDPDSMEHLRARVFLGLLLGTVPSANGSNGDGPSVGATPPTAPAPGAPAPGAPGAPAPGAPAPAAPAPRAPGGGSSDGVPAGQAWWAARLPAALAGGVTARVGVTVPLATLTGEDELPGEVAGYGAMPASVVRALAAGSDPKRWCYIGLDVTGRAVTHTHPSGGRPAEPAGRDGNPAGREWNPAGRDSNPGGPDRNVRESDPPGRGDHAPRYGRSGQPPPGSPGGDDLSGGPGGTEPSGGPGGMDPPASPGSSEPSGRLGADPASGRVDGSADGYPEDHEHRPGKDGYRPSRALRHAIEIRDRTCRFPTCSRPAHQCDADHTTPHGKGGPTCECNISCLCRRHHQVKQRPGWTLTQPRPGVLIWETPTGRRYTTEPEPYR